jgi:DNA polymerase-4
MSLRYLFVDMNAFFASVEQQDDRSLRGRPVAVVPMMARTTCCLAVSYEGRAFGVKTGTPVWQAERMCPDMAFVVGRHERYVQVHHRIVRAVGQCIPVDTVMSVDEMACRLLGDERTPAKASAIAQQIKAEIRKEFDWLRCSIGAGPSVFLAKVAADMQKPDGLTLIEARDLPGKIQDLKLTDFPGIGPRMEVRLRKFAVWDTRRLLALTPAQMCHAWGSRVHGWKWWYLLRGEDVPLKPTKRQTVGHSHVLPPELRTDAGSRGVLVRLIHKAAARLRDMGYWAGALWVSVRYEDGGRWDNGRRFARCQDTPALLRVFGELWESRPPGGEPMKVSMVLTDLVPARAATPSLFPDDQAETDLSHTMDRINRAFGKNMAHFGTMHGMGETAPTRIAFSQVPEFNPAFS